LSAPHARSRHDGQCADADRDQEGGEKRVHYVREPRRSTLPANNVIAEQGLHTVRLSIVNEASGEQVSTSDGGKPRRGKPAELDQLRKTKRLEFEPRELRLGGVAQRCAKVFKFDDTDGRKGLILARRAGQRTMEHAT